MNTGDDAKIGLVKFNTFAYKCTGLVGQDSKETLKQHISNMSAEGGTATYHGINEASAGITTETTETDVRKLMIVLTDGMSANPNLTKSSYINAESQGIEILTVLYNMGSAYYGAINNNPVMDWMNNYINSSIGAGQVVSADSGNIIDFFSNDAIRYVQGETIGTEVTSQTIVTEVRETVTITTQTGAEDVTNRREETILNCKPINYSLGQELIKLENPFDATQDYSVVADKTKMEAIGEVEIDSLDINNDSVGYTMNLTLKKRPVIDITCEKKVSSIKVTLADGNVLLYKDVENSENNIGTIISNPSIIDPKQYLAVMDDELLHGATLEIKYKIIVKDQGAPFNGTYTVYDYIDEELSFKVEDNSDWEIVYDKSDRVRGDEELSNLIENKTVIKREFNEANGHETYLTVTRLLATNSTDEYENYTEIIEYSNELGRRIYSTVPADMKLIELYKGTLDWDIHQIDEAKAETVNIIPPFGRNNSVFSYLNKYIENKTKFFVK